MEEQDSEQRPLVHEGQHDKCDLSHEAMKYVVPIARIVWYNNSMSCLTQRCLVYFQPFPADTFFIFLASITSCILHVLVEIPTRILRAMKANLDRA